MRSSNRTSRSAARWAMHTPRPSPSRATVRSRGRRRDRGRDRGPKGHRACDQSARDARYRGKAREAARRQSARHGCVHVARGRGASVHAGAGRGSRHAGLPATPKRRLEGAQPSRRKKRLARGTLRRFLFDLAREIGGMTVAELAERITVDEVAEWAAVTELDAAEREEQRKRTDLKSRVQHGVTDARSKLRTKRA